MSHWYDKDGNARHTWIDTDGAEKPTGLKQARKWGLFPSVSGIVRTWHNEGLATGRDYALLREAHRRRNEPDEKRFIRAVLDNAFSEWETASKAGKTIHGLLEDYLKTGKYANVPVQLPGLQSAQSHRLVEPALYAIKDLEILESERILVNSRLGYAGTMDFAYKSKETPSIAGVGDFKSTKTKPGEKVKPKQGQAMQIAAYYVAYWGGEDMKIGDNAEGRNIYISTTEIGRVETVIYSAERLRSEWEAFKACLTLWRLENNYDPRTKA